MTHRDYDPSSIEPERLATLPYNEWDVNLAELAMSHDVVLFKYIPDRFKTIKLCCQAIAGLPCLLKFVPDNIRNGRELWIRVIRSHAENVFDLIPMQLRTAALCMEALKADGTSSLNNVYSYAWAIRLLNYLPDEEITDELRMRLLRLNGFHIRYLRSQTEKTCLAAISERVGEFIYVRNKTPAICELALTKDGMFIQYVTEQTDHLCKLAIDQNPLCLKFLTHQACEYCVMAFTKAKQRYANDHNSAITFYLEDKMDGIRIQTREICLDVYNVNRLVFQGIRAVEHQRFVARATFAAMALTLKSVRLSTNLLVEILDPLSPVLFPRLNSISNPLSPTQMWSIVAMINLL